MILNVFYSSQNSFGTGCFLLQEKKVSPGEATFVGSYPKPDRIMINILMNMGYNQ